jgi:hypothetical protein
MHVIIPSTIAYSKTIQTPNAEMQIKRCQNIYIYINIYHFLIPPPPLHSIRACVGKKKNPILSSDFSSSKMTSYISCSIPSYIHLFARKSHDNGEFYIDQGRRRGYKYDPNPSMAG